MSKKELAIGVLGAGGNIGHTHSQNIATYVDGARLLSHPGTAPTLIWR